MPAHDRQPDTAANALRELDRAERLIASLPAEAQKQERLAAVGLLAGFVAHECRNRLTPIVGYARAAAGSPDDHRLVARALFRITESAQDLANLSELILSTVVPDASGASVEAAWGRARCEVSERCDAARVTIAEDIEPGLKAAISRSALTHMLENLLRNAVAVSQPGQMISFVARSTGNIVSLFLVDSADGMEPELEAMATVPLSSGTGGTGLGLALCRYLIEGAGGQLRVMSAPGKGTTISVELPATDHSG